MKLNINESILKLCVVLSLTTIIQGLAFFNKINLIVLFFIILLMISKIFTSKISFKTIISFFILSILYMFSMYFTTSSVEELGIYFHFAFWITCYCYFTKEYEEFFCCLDRNERFIKKFLFIWNLTVIFSLFFKISYASSWGNDLYFKSFSGSEHRFASAALFVMILAGLNYTKNKKVINLFYIILPFIFICLSGARIYMLAAMGAFIYFYYVYCKNKQKFWFTVIPITLIVLVGISFTPMINKIAYTNQDGYYGYLATLTSGRSMFWEKDIIEYNTLPVLNKFVGNGFNYVYDVNFKYTGRKIFAHNDYINILMNFGILGLILYFSTFIRFLKKAFKDIKGEKFLKICVFMIYFFNAFFNSVYVYMCATLSIPFLVYCINCYEKNKYKMGDKK